MPRIHPGKNLNRNRATALGYNPEEDAAPKVVATGEGVIADQILATAREHNIPIKEDPLLLAALAEIDVNQEIPPELYQVVAAVLAYVYRIQQKRVVSGA